MYNYILCGFILTFVKKDFLIMDYSVLYQMQPFCCISYLQSIISIKPQ